MGIEWVGEVIECAPRALAGHWEAIKRSARVREGGQSFEMAKSGWPRLACHWHRWRGGVWDQAAVDRWGPAQFLSCPTA